MISTQSILSSVFPGGIPPELYGSLPEITGHAQRLADLAAGFTPEEVDRCSLRPIEIGPSALDELLSTKRKPAGKLPPNANEIIASMKAQGMTHAEIGEKLGVTESASKKRYAEWKKQQAGIKNAAALYKPGVAKALYESSERGAAELYEPGAVEAAVEAKAAEAQLGKSLTVEGLVKSMDHPGNFDSEILIAVNKRFPGNGLTVDDIACMRWQA